MHKYLIRIFAGIAIVVGLVVASLAVWVGSCDAFGGRCPSDPEPLLENDVFGGALVGVGLIFVGIITLTHKDRRRTLLRLGIAVPLVILVALFLVELAG